MKSLHDCIYNWLSMKLVVEARPTDGAAKETLELFEEILATEYLVTEKSVEEQEDFLIVTVKHGGNESTYRFSKEYANMVVNSMLRQSEKYVLFE